MTDQERIQIGQWVRDYTAPLLQRAQYLLDDEDEAQDLVQETFLTACDALSRFEGKSSPLVDTDPASQGDGSLSEALPRRGDDQLRAVL